MNLLKTLNRVFCKHKKRELVHTTFVENGGCDVWRCVSCGREKIVQFGKSEAHQKLERVTGNKQ